MSFDPNSLNLTALVLEKITALGDDAAEEYFGVSHGTIVAWRTRKTPPNLAAAQKCWDDNLIYQTPEVWGKSGNAPIQILLPIYREVHPLNQVTMIRNIRMYGCDKINVIPRLRTLIDEARNDLAAKFLASKSEWAIFCDSDMVLPCGNAAMMRGQGWQISDMKGNRSAIERVMSHPKEYKIVGGLYRDRKNGNRAQTERAFRSAEENTRLLSIMDGKNTTDDGLEENGWVATGFVRIHRSALEEMTAEAKPGGKLEDISPPPGRENEPLGFFGRTSKWRGEDIAFGRRAGLCGIKTFTDVGCTLGHCGDRIF